MNSDLTHFTRKEKQKVEQMIVFEVAMKAPVIVFFEFEFFSKLISLCPVQMKDKVHRSISGDKTLGLGVNFNNELSLWV